MAEFKNLKANEILFKEGEKPDNMYIIKSGQIAIFAGSGENEKQLTTMGVGELVGELALFDKRHRSASARALCDSSLVVLPYAALEKQLDQLPDWVRITMKSLSDKLRVTNRKIIE